MAEFDNDMDLPGGGGGGVKKILLWAVLGGVMLAIGSAAGFGVGSLLSGPSEASAEEPEPAADAETGEELEEYAFQELEPITVNLDEPRMARYVRVKVVLAIEPAKAEKVRALVEQQKPELKNWLTVYLAGCSLRDVRGPEALNRIRREICDAFNELLAPEQSPLIHHVLFGEWAIQ